MFFWVWLWVEHAVYLDIKVVLRGFCGLGMHLYSAGVRKRLRGYFLRPECWFVEMQGRGRFLPVLDLERQYAQQK